MGFAILFIMLFHLENRSPFLDTHFFVIGDSGVEIFLLLSGLGVFFSLSRSKESTPWSFYKRRLIRILPAFWLVIIPLSLFSFIKGAITFPIFVTRILGLSAFNEAARGYWYITALLVCYIITPPLYQYLRKTSDRMGILLIVLSFAICYVLSFVIGVEVLLRRIPVFILGMYIGKQCMTKDSIISIPFFIVAAIALFAATQYYRMQPDCEMVVYRVLCFALVVPLCVTVAYLVSLSRAKLIRSVLDSMGRISLELYLMHIFVLNFVCPHLKNHLLYILLFFLFSVLLSYALHSLCGIIQKRIECVKK